jgi:hypothetical protein
LDSRFRHLSPISISLLRANLVVERQLNTSTRQNCWTTTGPVRITAFDPKRKFAAAQKSQTWPCTWLASSAALKSRLTSIEKPGQQWRGKNVKHDPVGRDPLVETFQKGVSHLDKIAAYEAARSPNQVRWRGFVAWRSASHSRQQWLGDCLPGGSIPRPDPVHSFSRAS